MPPSIAPPAPVKSPPAPVAPPASATKQTAQPAKPATPPAETELEAPDTETGETGVTDPAAELDALIKGIALPAKPKEKPPEPSDKAPETQEKSPKPELEGPKTLKDLRNSYNELRDKRLPAVEKENAELKTRLDSFKDVPEKEKERTALQSELKSAKERLAQYEENIRFLDYTKSAEYKEKFEKPLIEASEAALAEIGDFTIEDESGSSRKATNSDFIALLQMNTQAAYTQAKSWFGDLASEVMTHRRKILDLKTARDKAIDRFKTEGDEHQKKSLAGQVEERTRLQSLWVDTEKALREGAPDIYSPSDGDEEGNALLEKSHALTEAAFDQTRAFTPEQRIRMLVTIKNQAAALPRALHRLKQKDARIAELETELAQFRESEPAPGARPAAGEEANGESIADPAQELTKMVNEMKGKRF